MLKATETTVKVVLIETQFYHSVSECF